MTRLPTLTFRAALLLAILSVLSCSSQGNRPLTDAEIEKYKMDEQELIAETIPDETRKNGVVELLQERDSLLKKETSSLCQHAQTIKSLNANYHSSREQYALAFDEYNKSRWAIQQEYVSVIAGIKQLTTAKEWQAIAKYQQKYLNGARLTMERVVRGNVCS